MKEELKQEIQSLIDKYNLNCSIDEFENKNYIYWNWISKNEKLGESFIEKYKSKLDWYWISKCQKLKEPFIEKHKDYINWDCIIKYQDLSPSFRKKYNIGIPKVSS